MRLTYSYVAWLHSDGDGFLSLDEFNNLQLATGSESVEKDDWPEVCGMFDLDPNKGFDVAALAVGYEGSMNGALVKDATMVLKLRQAERGVTCGRRVAPMGLLFGLIGFDLWQVNSQEMKWRRLRMRMRRSSR